MALLLALHCSSVHAPALLLTLPPLQKLLIRCHTLPHFASLTSCRFEGTPGLQHVAFQGSALEPTEGEAQQRARGGEVMGNTMSNAKDGTSNNMVVNDLPAQDFFSCARKLVETCVDTYKDTNDIKYKNDIKQSNMEKLSECAARYGKHIDHHLNDCIQSYESLLNKDPNAEDVSMSITKFKMWLGTIKPSSELDKLLQDAYGAGLYEMNSEDSRVFGDVLQFTFCVYDIVPPTEDE